MEILHWLPEEDAEHEEWVEKAQHSGGWRIKPANVDLYDYANDTRGGTNHEIEMMKIIEDDFVKKKYWWNSLSLRL